ncbi:MAG TPA: hypothetical protein VGO62_09950, partial [Myxococcota bacterium]
MNLAMIGRLLALAVALVSLGAGPAFAEEYPKDLGLDLMPWAKKIDEHRFESPRDYEGTVKFFRDKWKTSKPVRWSHEVSVPAVKYIHVESMVDSTKWSGINIYELP